MTNAIRIALGLGLVSLVAGCGWGRSAQMTLAEMDGQWFVIPQHRSKEALADPNTAPSIIAEENARHWDARPKVTTYYDDIACQHPDAPCLN